MNTLYYHLFTQNFIIILMPLPVIGSIYSHLHLSTIRSVTIYQVCSVIADKIQLSYTCSCMHYRYKQSIYYLRPPGRLASFFLSMGHFSSNYCHHYYYWYSFVKRTVSKLLHFILVKAS